MLGPLVFTKISFTSCLYLTFIAFIQKEKLLCLSSSSMISLTSLFQSFSSHTSHYCPSWQLLPIYHKPWVPDSTHMTWRPWSVWPPCHRTSRGLKTEDLGPCGRMNGPERGKTLQQLSGEKNWYNSEMVVFTKIVIISAVSDGFLKFQKFWHRDTYGMTCSTPERRMRTQMPHSDTKHAFPLFPPRLYIILPISRQYTTHILPKSQ